MSKYLRDLDRANESRRTCETMCTTCGRRIGVLVLKFKSTDNPKVARHKNGDAQWCSGSGVAVHPNAVLGVMPRPHGAPVILRGPDA